MADQITVFDVSVSEKDMKNYRMKENFMIINNWQGGNDDFLFIRTELPRIFI